MSETQRKRIPSPEVVRILEGSGLGALYGGLLGLMGGIFLVPPLFPVIIATFLFFSTMPSKVIQGRAHAHKSLEEAKLPFRTQAGMRLYMNVLSKSALGEVL